ncbi:hypothetical protein ACFE04_004849 [Oxalis oulophora]
MDIADSYEIDSVSRKSDVAEEVFQILKEICMEKEIPFTHKCLIENCQVDHSIICCMLSSDSESAKESPEESPRNITSTPNQPELSQKLLSKIMEDFRTEDGNLANYGDHNAMIKPNSEIPESAEWEQFMELASNPSSRSFSHFQDNHEHGSFLGSIVGNSGSTPCSGNVSLRLTSCNTSSRSFAFPTLASEWNCSPIRMVKAERKGYRKFRKIFSLCCKF